MSAGARGYEIHVRVSRRTNGGREERERAGRAPGPRPEHTASKQAGFLLGGGGHRMGLGVKSVCVQLYRAPSLRKTVYGYTSRILEFYWTPYSRTSLEFYLWLWLLAPRGHLRGRVEMRDKLRSSTHPPGLAVPLLDDSDANDDQGSQCTRALAVRPLAVCFAACAMVLSAAVLYQASSVANASRDGQTVAASTLTEQPLRVLVTGYGAFDNMTTNPSQAVALELNGTCMNGMCIEGWVLSVDTHGASRVAQALTARYRAVGSATAWDAIIHLGLEASSKGLRIELAAANVRAVLRGEPGAGAWSAEVPCNKSGTPWDEIIPGAPCLLASTAPLDQMTMQDGPSPPLPLELWSRDAGTFFCNEALYRTLHAVRSLRLRSALSAKAQGAAMTKPGGSQPPARLLPAVFIHLPTVENAAAAMSTAFVRRAAELMVGMQPAGEDEEDSNEAERVGADADRHGCRASAGYAWCAATGRCERPWEHPCESSAGSLAAGGLGRRGVQRSNHLLGPEGSYAGAILVLGNIIRVAVDVGTRPQRMNLSVASVPDVAAFRCHEEEWTLDADGRVDVKQDECWKTNVAATVEDLEIRYDREADRLILHGYHPVVLFRLALQMTLARLDLHSPRA